MKLGSIPIYVVTAKAFTARHEHMRRIEAKIGVRFEFIFDYDVDELRDSALERVRSDMPKPSISCLLKHFEAQRRFLMTDSEICMVLEDDVILFDEFERTVESVLSKIRDIPPGWLIFLGGADNKLDTRFLNVEPFDLLEIPISTAECYLLDRRGCLKRNQWIEKHGFVKPADHQLAHMDRELGIKHYRLGRPVATQGSITGQFVTTLDSSRRKHSLIFLNLKYRWNRFRRQVLPRLIGEVLGKIK